MSTQIRKKDIVLLISVLFILLMVMVVVFDVIPNKKKAIATTNKEKEITANNDAIKANNNIAQTKLQKLKIQEEELKADLKKIDETIENKVPQYKFVDINEVEEDLENEFRKHGLRFTSTFQPKLDGPKVYKYTLEYKNPTLFIGAEIINPNEDPTSEKQKLYDSIMNNALENEDEIYISGFDRNEDVDASDPTAKYSLQKPAMIMQKKGTPNEKIKAIISALNSKYTNIRVESYSLNLKNMENNDDENFFYIARNGDIATELKCKKIQGTITFNLSILMVKNNK